MNRNRGQMGITLVELLVVIAILSIIAAVVASNLHNFFERNTEVVSNSTFDRVVYGQVAAIDMSGHGEDDDCMTFYIVDGPEFVVTCSSVNSSTMPDVARNCSLFDGRWSYYLKEVRYTTTIIYDLVEAVPDHDWRLEGEQ